MKGKAGGTPTIIGAAGTCNFVPPVFARAVSCITARQNTHTHFPATRTNRRLGLRDDAPGIQLSVHEGNGKEEPDTPASAVVIR